MLRTALGSLLLAPLLLTGCEVGDCGADDPPVEVESGTFALVEGQIASRFPHAGHDVSIEVDREAGIVRARWTDAEGGEIVETWRMTRYE